MVRFDYFMSLSILTLAQNSIKNGDLLAKIWSDSASRDPFKPIRKNCFMYANHRTPYIQLEIPKLLNGRGTEIS